MLTIEILPMEKVGALKPMLMELADHHNQVAVNFQGLYPLINIDEKIKILHQGIGAGNTVAAILSDGSNWQGFVFFHILAAAAVSTIFISDKRCADRVPVNC